MLIKLKGLFPVKLKTYLKKFKKFNAYHELDKKLLKYINYENGFYIDCGANDGVNQSTTWYFEKSLKWNGILIEPIPDTFCELKKNRNKNNYFYNNALVSSDFKSDQIEFFFNKRDTLTGKISSEDFLHKNNMEKIIAKTKTLDEIINNIKISKQIDLFSLDVEGYEFNVLDGINFDKINFKYILIETEFPEKLTKFLNSKKYNLVERLSNYNFVEKPLYGDYLFKYK